MKKNVRYLFLLILLLSCFGIRQTEAYTIHNNGTIGGSFPGIRRYTANINGTNYMAYCLDPGRKAAYSSNTIETLDPSKKPVGSAMYKFAIGAQYIYQRMIENGWTNASDVGYAVGNTAFRLLARQYYDGEMKGKKDGDLYKAYHAYDGMGSRVARITGVQDGINLATEAINFAEQNGGTEYSTLVQNNTIHGIGWTTVRSETVPVAGTNNYQLTVEIEPSSPDIYSVDYSKFRIGFLNTTAKIVSQSAVQGNGNHAVITVVFDASSWDKSDLGAYVDAYYCDPRSAASMLYLLHTSSDTQRFIVVLPGTAGTCTEQGGGNPHGGSRTKIKIPVDSETCLCDTTTGTYTYQKIEEGKVTIEKSWAASSPTPSGIDKSKCPGKCDKKPTCQIIDNQPYCKDGEKCDPEQFDKECKHSCQTPEQSGDGKYYCQESSPGAGDGPECTEKEYKRDCLGEPLCTPNVTIPSDCNNFDTESKYNGHISDINKVSTSCNPDVNQVKACILDNKDATGASYEATTELSGNPYCKVWCAEDYRFNLPTAQYSKSGGYFTLSTKIIGTRDCYVGGADNPKEAIDTNKFNNDLANAQKEVIDAWNIYSYYKAAASAAIVEKDKEDEGTCTDSEGNDSPGASGSVTIVSMNWNFDVYDYNGNHSLVNSYTVNGTKYEGKYSDGSISCGCSSCSKHEGHDPREKDYDNKTNYTTLRNQAYEKLKNAVTKLNGIIANYNSCTGIINNTNYSANLTNASPSSTASSSWENDMKFDPKVEFIYNEDYMSQINGEFKQVNDSETSNNMFCSGDIDDKYHCQSGSSSSLKTTAKNYLTCDDNGCGVKTAQISTAKWIRKSKTHTAEYKPNNEFSTYTQYGTIKFKWDQCSGNDCLWTNLPDDAIPVMLAQKSGVFPFKFTFSQIGQSNSNGSLGRLIGGSTSVLTEYNKLDKSETCNSGSRVTATADGGYVCHYLNNCDDCDFICEDGVCDFDDDGNQCGDCDLTCETCLFDGDRAMYTFRIVSLNNLFTNTERRIGYNWYNGGDSGRTENEKAKVTRQEISEAGESIYDKPQYEFVLEPGDMKNIREYNNAAGSYTNSKIPDEYAASLSSNNAIYCEKVTLNGIEYNVRCKSGFLDLIENSGKTYASEMTRITSNNSNVGGESNNAWELYTETDYCKDGKCLTHGIGPSWRIRSVS